MQKMLPMYILASNLFEKDDSDLFKDKKFVLV